MSSIDRIYLIFYFNFYFYFNSSEMNMMAFRLTLGALIGAFPEPVDPQEVKKVVEIFNIFQVI